MLALLACALWGSLYPFIKIGYSAFEIAAGNIPAIILFAGIRFLISGAVMVGGVSVCEKRLKPPLGKCFAYVAITGALSIVLHYMLTYIALSSTDGGKAAILKQVSFLLMPCFAFLFRRDDGFSVKKVISAVLGFGAVIVINFNGLEFSFCMGDMLILCASFCSAVSVIVAKKAYESYSPRYILAYGQFFGGAVLCITGLLSGGVLSHFDLKAAAVLAYICFASITSYILWETLLKYNSMSRLSVIKSAEPLFAAVFSGILLGEDILRPEYLLAAAMVSAAIVLSANYEKIKK